MNILRHISTIIFTPSIHSIHSKGPINRIYPTIACTRVFFRLEMVTSRLLELFIRHTCLIRNLSEGGKLKIAADMVQLEFAVTPLCRRFEELGHIYKQYRTFRYV